MANAERQRTRVVREAARLFHRYGYAVASLDLVARELRIREVREYRDYFADQESLAVAAFDYGVERAEQALDRAMFARDGAMNRLDGFVDGFRSLVEHPDDDGGCPLFRVAPHQPGALPFLQARTREVVSQWRHRIRRTVRFGLRDGEIHPGTDPEEVAAVMLSNLEGAAAMYLLYEDASHLDRAQAHLSSYLSGIVA